jgi:hypothetical protein
MSKTRLLLAAVLMLGLSATPLRATEHEGDALAEPDLEVLINASQSNRKALVAANLELTKDEAAKFWPIYDRYQAERGAIAERLGAVIQEYTTTFTTLSDDKAVKLVDEFLSVEAERVKVKRAFVTEFAKVLPGRKLARLVQIENKMDAVIRYDIASTIPVIDEKASAPTN